VPQFITAVHDVQQLLCILSRQSAMAWNAVIDLNNTDSQTTRKTSSEHLFSFAYSGNSAGISFLYAQLTDCMQSSCRSQRKTTQRPKYYYL